MTTPPESSYREIPLTQGQVALVSAHRYEELSQFKWYAHWAPHTQSFYAVRWLPTVNGKRSMEWMHRRILGLQRDDRRKGDHRHGSTLNNQDSNLRIATNMENCYNQKKRSSNKSGFKGAAFHKKTGKYQATIRANGKLVYLGLHETPELAHAAYIKAAERLHGEFARTV